MILIHTVHRLPPLPFGSLARKTILFLKMRTTARLAFLGPALLSLARALAANVTNGTAIYKDPSASIDDRVADLLSRMTIEEKVAQTMQGDITNWMSTTTGAFNRSGLVANMAAKAGQFYVGYPVAQSWISKNVEIAQRYLVEETRLGIPALVQSEGIHGFLIGNATIFNSPIAYACSFDPDVSPIFAEFATPRASSRGVYIACPANVRYNCPGGPRIGRQPSFCASYGPCARTTIWPCRGDVRRVDLPRRGNWVRLRSWATGGKRFRNREAFR